MSEAKKSPRASKKGQRKLSVNIPQNREQVGEYIEYITTHHREVQQLAANYESQIIKLQKEAEQKIAHAQTEIKDRFDAIHVYAKQNRKELTVDGKKTIAYPGGDIGWRFTPQSVRIKNEVGVIEEIKAKGLAKQFIRTKEEINREAMLADQDVALSLDGVDIVQTELFFLKVEVLDVEITDPPTKKKAEKKKGDKKKKTN